MPRFHIEKQSSSDSVSESSGTEVFVNGSIVHKLSEIETP